MLDEAVSLSIRGLSFHVIDLIKDIEIFDFLNTSLAFILTIVESELLLFSGSLPRTFAIHRYS